MKVAAVSTLLFATLALANPAPAAQPNAVQAAHPMPRADAPAARLAARDPNPHLEARKKKKPKTSGGKNNNTNSTDNAARVVSPSRALELGALGFGVMEIVRLWG